MNLKQYIIDGMTCGMGFNIVYYKDEMCKIKSRVTHNIMDNIHILSLCYAELF